MTVIHRLALAFVVFALAARAPAAAQSATTPQRVPSARVVAPIIISPAENALVTGALEIVIEVPPDVAAREYTLECAYWDGLKNAWVFPGTLGPPISSGRIGRTAIAIDQLVKFSPTAVKWQIHGRMSDPPGPWSSWRTFTIELPVRPANAMQSALKAALQEASVQYVIAASGRLLKGDNQRSLSQFAATLDLLRSQKQQIAAEIAAKSKAVEASCACQEHAARCAELVRDLGILRRNHSSWLSAVHSQVMRDSRLSATDLQKLVDAMAPGGQAALNLALYIASTIVELETSPCIRSQ